MDIVFYKCQWSWVGWQCLLGLWSLATKSANWHNIPYTPTSFPYSLGSLCEVPSTERTHSPLWDHKAFCLSFLQSLYYTLIYNIVIQEHVLSPFLNWKFLESRVCYLIHLYVCKAPVPVFCTPQAHICLQYSASCLAVETLLPKELSFTMQGPARGSLDRP